MGKYRRGRSERLPMHYLTEGKIQDMALSLTPRDMEILGIIAQFKYMNTKQIRSLIPSFERLKSGHMRLNKRLRILFDLHFINKASPTLGAGEGTSMQYCWLDKGGSYLLYDNIAPKTRSELPIDYLHYSAITDVYIHLKQTTSIIYFVNEHRLQTLSLVPDILIVFNSNGKEFTYIIEVDRCFKKEKQEVDKILDYHNWKRSGAWTKEDFVSYQTLPQFPSILYVIDDSRKYWQQRVSRIKRALEKYNISIQFKTLSELL